MATFARITLGIAAVIVALTVLVLFLKLLFVAAIVAALGIGVALAARRLQRRFGQTRPSRVTALTARR